MKPYAKNRLNWVGVVCLFLVAAFQPAQAALLGINLSSATTVPYFVGSNASSASFDTTTDALVIRSETSSFALTPPATSADFWYVFAEGFDISNPATYVPGKITVRVQVNNAGVVSGSVGDDLVIRGVITDQTGVVKFSGVLLTGEVVAMGSQSGASTSRFDFRFRVTGGALASFYSSANKDAGVVSALEGSTFTGSFAQNFSAIRAKTDVGGIPSLCVSLEKQVSLNGVDWADADTVGAPDVPVAAVPSDAHYRMIATNCGTAPLVDVTVTDPTLGLSYLIGNLAPGASQTLTESEAGVLLVRDRCDHAATLINSAQVSGKSQARTETRVAADDAVLQCVTTPQIALKKQISVDGGATWMDADNPGTAPVVTAPHGAEYRFIVTNTGTAALTGVVINDATLGIINYPVGDLAVGASATVGSGTIPEATVAERCANPGEFTNTASTSGASADDGSVVNDSNVAVLVCAGEPGIEIIKQISVDGGASWADANAFGDADVPTVPFPHGAEYRFIVRNVGQVDLVNVSVDDPDLGVTYDIPGVLAVGAEVTVASGDVGGLLTIATRCDSSGTLTNVASVTGESALTADKVTDSDPAVISCVGTPGIQLRKQISLNGIDWADADTVGAPDTPSAEAPADAYYRFLVSNVGNVDLVNVVVSDPTIGISHTIGSLLIGQSVVIDSGVIPDGLLVADRCTSAGDFVNVADVTGSAADTGAQVTDTDPAVLSCTTPPPSDCGCEGKVTSLTLKYLGDKIAHVQVKQKKDGAVVFDGTVLPGDSFTVTGMDSKGTLTTEIKIYVDGVFHTAIHTSCSQPIGPGLVAGDFEVTDGSSRGFPELCPVDEPPPPGGDGKGCTPGYWRQAQHFGNWVGYTPAAEFSSVFEDAFPGMTLGEVVQIGGGGLNALGRHTVAALLNAASSEVEYGMSPSDVVDAFNAVYPGSESDYEALKNQFAAMNERGCPLGRACLPGDDKGGKSGGHDKPGKDGFRDKGGKSGGRDKGGRSGGHDKGDHSRCDHDKGGKDGDKSGGRDKGGKGGDKSGGHDRTDKFGDFLKGAHDRGDHSRCSHSKGGKSS